MATPLNMDVHMPLSERIKWAILSWAVALLALRGVARAVYRSSLDSPPPPPRKPRLSAVYTAGKGIVMSGSKPWYRSKTIWGALITLIIGALQLLQVSLGGGEPPPQGAAPDAGAAITAPDEGGGGGELAIAIATLVGGGLALIGRASAKQPLERVGGGMPMLALLTLPMLAMATGCSSAAEDRGTWGDVRSAVNVQFNFPDGQLAPSIDAYTNPSVSPPAVAEAAATSVEASASGASQGLVARTGSNVVIVHGGIHVTVSGDSDTASAGDSAQSPTGPDIDSTLSVPLTP